MCFIIGWPLKYRLSVPFQNACNAYNAHVVFVDDRAEDIFVWNFTQASRDSELFKQH